MELSSAAAAAEDPIGLESLHSLMNLCNFLLCVVSQVNQKAVCCSTEVEARTLLKMKSVIAIYNSSSSEASDRVRLLLIRECNRSPQDCIMCCWDGGNLVPISSESTSRKAKRARTSTPLSLPQPSIRSMETTATTTLPLILFHIPPIGRRFVPNFEASCLFAGSRIDGRLMTRFIQGLDISNARQSFTEFISAEESSRIFNGDEPFFAGFFLHESQFSHKLVGELKQMFCTILPVFVHLSQSSNSRKIAEWWCCSDSSCAIKFMSQNPGWVVNFEVAEAAVCQSGFDVFFKQGSDAVTVVNTETFREERISRNYGVFTDAHKRHETVPFCASILKNCDFERRFPSLFLTDLVLVDKNVVWSFIDVGARDIVYVVALLSKHQYRQGLGKNQKPSYLNALTWILSRTGAASATTYQCSGNLFAVRTACCFMLDQMARIRAADVPPGLKQWYVAKGASSAEVPDTKFLTSIIDNYRSAQFINAQGNREAHEVSNGGAGMMFSQMYPEAMLCRIRSSLDVLPTLQFYNNSCWMETAINALFAIPFARIKLFSIERPPGFNTVCKCLRSLFDIMCVYGPSDFNRVPILECQRCGVYPSGDTAPPVLGQEGYDTIFASQEESWGSVGCAVSTLLRFCTSLQLNVSQVLYDPEAIIGSEYQTAIQSGMVGDVMLLSASQSQCIQPSNITGIEVIPNGFCCAVLFGNGAHHFSLCKAMKGENWTVKDNIVSKYTTFPTFKQALDGAFALHPKNDNYFVHTLVYYHDDISDGDA